MQTQELKIPKERVGVLIGEKGTIKRRIEKKAKVKIDVTAEGDVTIEGDFLGVYETINVVKAIGRGFNPEISENLFKDNFAFEIIDLNDFAGKSQKKRTRLKGRVIGEDGKARKFIENYTNVHISVFGKTITIIGDIEEVTVAKQAIEMLLEGSPHTSVYRWMEKKIRSLR